MNGGFSATSVRALVGSALLCAAVSASAAPSLEVGVSSRRVVVGDAFRLSVSARGIPSALNAQPQFEFPGAAPLSSPSVQQSSSFVNGVGSSSVSWTWAAVPASTGLVHFGQARLPLPGGKVLRAVVPDVQVVPPPPQPWVRVSLSGPEEVFPQQDFSVAVAVEVENPSGTAVEGAPVLRSQSPRLSVPWLFGEGLGSEAVPALAPARLAAELENGGVGSAAVQFVANGVCLVGASPETSADGGTVRYSFAVPFRAVSEGEVEFSPVRFAGSVAIGGDGGQARISPYIVALSEPLRVRIVPPPVDGRPASWGGVLATRAAISVSLDLQTCRQGDPLVLSVEIEGDFDPSAVRRPDPFADPAVSEIFRQWGDPSRTESDGSVRFDWKVRAIASGTLEVPPIEFAWFDPVKQRYGVVSSAPLPLRVDPVADFDPDALFAAVGASLEYEQTGVAAPPALSLDPAGAEPPPRPANAAVALLLCAPPMVWLLAVAFPFMMRAARRAATAARRFGARGGAAARLRRAETPGQAAAACASLLTAKTGLRIGAGFGPDQLRSALLSRGVSSSAADEAAALLRGMEEAAYRPGADVAAEVRSRRGRLAQIVSSVRMLALASLLALSLQGGAAEARFAWRQACAAAARAEDPAAALAAARSFRDIAEASGGGSGPCLRNLGATLLLAERNEEALDAFRRAAALEGETPESRAGASAARRDAPEPWWHAPLRPVLRMSLEARRGAAAAAWAALWLALALRRAFSERFAGIRRSLAVCAAAAAILCAAAAASVSSSERVLSQPFPTLEEEVDATPEQKTPAQK